MSEDQRLSTVSPTILVVDDEPNIRRTLELVLVGQGYQVRLVETAEAALAQIRSRQQPIDLVLLDIHLPGLSGLDALAQLRRENRTTELPVIVISGHASVEDAARAMRLGASDFFEKPLNRERVLVSVDNCIRGARLGRSVEQLRAELESRYEMLGASEPIQRLYRAIEKVAPTRATVLISGQSGTGKELVSRAIHRLSPRRDAPFVKVNCAAIAKERIESELFGHEPGAFGADQGLKQGVFERAHGGTLFLDEIADMDLAAQAKVLRALQNGEVVRVGSRHQLSVDVRVLVATNRDLPAEVSAGRFREDLLFRLQVFPLHLPSLEERGSEDLHLLAGAFVERFCDDNGLRRKKVEPAVFELLSRRKWPGNVRELKNVMERATIIASDVITVADLPEDPHENPFEEALDETRSRLSFAAFPPPVSESGARLSLKEYREAAERAYILRTLVEQEWNISQTAVRLGVERTNLHKKIRAYGIRRGDVS